MLQKRLVIATVVGLLALPLIASAAAGFDTVAPFAGTSSSPLISSITSIVNAMLTLAAVVAVIFIIIGGVRYITAQGDEDAVALAKNTIIYAAIGIIVIALSAVIINFVITSI